MNELEKYIEVLRKLYAENCKKKNMYCPLSDAFYRTWKRVSCDPDVWRSENRLAEEDPR